MDTARGDGDLSAKERHLGWACGAGFRIRSELCSKFNRTTYVHGNISLVLRVNIWDLRKTLIAMERRVTGEKAEITSKPSLSLLLEGLVETVSKYDADRGTY